VTDTDDANVIWVENSTNTRLTGNSVTDLSPHGALFLGTGTNPDLVRAAATGPLRSEELRKQKKQVQYPHASSDFTGLHLPGGALLLGP
jgi:hypothetical protein